jgi:hypothetical protein
MSTVKSLLRRARYRARLLTGAAIACAQESARFLAPIISFMARTGKGTDACLKRKCLPLPVHFYSPVPDLADLDRRGVWDRCSGLDGIDFRPDVQVAFLKEMGRQFGHECDWPTHPTGDRLQFYTDNVSFSYGCAAGTHCILRHFRPRRVVEIGSGNSSLVIAEALQMNGAEAPEGAAEYTIVDPYPSEQIRQGLPGVTRLVDERVELLDVSFFEELAANDVLFIDSGHTVRIGSDVNYLILDVLPRLAPGVIIHFHDIPLPAEYPRIYATNPRFRVFWTEAYLLQAFLCHNSRFEILLAMAYLTAHRNGDLLAAFPLYDPAEHRATSGSFWIRRAQATRRV